MSDGTIVALDTSGVEAVVALGGRDGTLVAQARWRAGYRHGEELLPRLDALLRSNGRSLADVRAIVAGTGPGAFTGLRVGLATAKALARGLGVPIVGVATSEALLAAAASLLGRDAADLVLLLPAGPSDRVIVEGGSARLLRADEPSPCDASPDGDERAAGCVAVDLAGRADPAAVANGEAAATVLAAWLVRLGAARLHATGGAGDDLARLVPEYVTLPRGIESVSGEVRWSLS